MTSHAILILILMILVCLTDAAAQVFFKSAIERVNTPARTVPEMFKLAWRLLSIPRVWLSFWIGLINLALWVIVLSKAELNFAYSLSSIHYIFIALAGQFILKEKVGKKRWGATLLITFGILIVSLS